MMGNRGTLILDKNSVFKSKIEGYKEFEKSFFKDVYQKATYSLLDIVNADKSETDDTYNNIIAFVGDRGSGKTSTMKSFRGSLKGGKFKILLKAKEKEECKIRGENYFENLDIIDPSLFSKKESIVEIIVAEMFKRFKDKKTPDNMIEKQQLVKQFGKVHKDITVLNMDKNILLSQNNDEIEMLISLSSAISLKKDMHKLIDLYLEYMNQCSNDKSKVLVVTIDDLDMNLTVGERMLEDIRKYLIQSNVIILMAVKFEQLEEIISQKFVVDLKENYKLYKNIDTIDNKDKILSKFKSDIDDKTEKYLDKIIPYNRRCIMPKLDSREIQVEIITNDFKNIKINNYNQNSIWEIISCNFYEKLGYIIATENHCRALISKNLRGFIELIVLLNSMEDKNYEENLRNIRQYYKDVVINEIKSRDKAIFLKELLYCYLNDINKRSLVFLNSLTLEKEEKFEKDNIEKDKSELIDLRYINRNKSIIKEERICLGDIVTWIKRYENVIENNDERKFIEIFKSVYSLRLLHGYYDNQINIKDKTGIDFVGKYFEITGNKNNKKINIEFETDKINRLEDKIKIWEKLELEKNNIMEIIPLLTQPRFDKTKQFQILLRREEKKYLTIKEIDKFQYFNVAIFNIVGYNIYKNQIEEAYEESINEIYNLETSKNNDYIKEINLKIKNIINLDCWLKILLLLDKEYQSSSAKSSVFLNKLEDKILRFNKDYNLLDINGVSLANECETVETFVENYIPEINTDKYKKKKEEIIKYIGEEIGLLAKRKKNHNIKEINKFRDGTRNKINEINKIVKEKIKGLNLKGENKYIIMCEEYKEIKKEDTIEKCNENIEVNIKILEKIKEEIESEQYNNTKLEIIGEQDNQNIEEINNEKLEEVGEE